MHDCTKKKPIFWSRKMIEYFIQLYKQNECLYDSLHKDYCNRTRKTEAFECMLQKMQKCLPELQMEDVHLKIKAMRDQLSNEFGMIEEAEASGSSYIPKLWCFEQLKFLHKHMACLTTENVEKKEDVAWEEMHGNDGDDDSESDGGNSLFSEITQNKLQRKFSWTRDVLAIFIKLFKRYPVLYDPNHKNYKNRPRREDARNKLLNDMKHVDPTISLGDVCVKINCLRCQYSRELRRIVAAEKTNTTYKPKLWCFDELSYLNNSDVIIKPLHEYDNDDESQTVCDNSTAHDSEEIYNNDNTINNETMEEEQIQEIIDEDEIEYDETLLKCQSNSIIEIAQNVEIIEAVHDYEHKADDQHMYDNIQEHDQSPPLKKSRYCEEISDNSEKESKLKIKKNLPTESYKGTKRKKPTDSQDGKYEWLSDLVAAQMEEISPTFRADFTWDVQCLIRKYILKTKAEAEAPDKSPQDAKKNKSCQDLVLPRSSNVSLNISFL